MQESLCWNGGTHSVTPLHVAAMEACPQIMDVLLAYGADPYACNEKDVRTAQC